MEAPALSSCLFFQISRGTTTTDLLFADEMVVAFGDIRSAAFSTKARPTIVVKGARRTEAHKGPRARGAGVRRALLAPHGVATPRRAATLPPRNFDVFDSYHELPQG